MLMLRNSIALTLVAVAATASFAFEGMALYTNGSLWGAGKIHLVVMDKDGNTKSDTEIYGAGACDPKFSPDGKKIAFIRGSDKKVLVMNLADKKETVIGTASGDLTYGMGSWRHADKIYFTGDKNLKVYSFSGDTVTNAWTGSDQSFRELDIAVNLRGLHGGMPPIYGFDLSAKTDKKVMDRCGGSINKSGDKVTNMHSDHRGFDIKNWGNFGVSKSVKTPTGSEALDPQFSGNSDDFVLCNDGGKSSMKPYVYRISTGTWKKIGNPGGNNHASDFWAETPPGLPTSVQDHVYSVVPESANLPSLGKGLTVMHIGTGTGSRLVTLTGATVGRGQSGLTSTNRSAAIYVPTAAGAAQR